MKAKRYAALRARVGDRRVVLSVSGGKDSAAASLFLREAEIEHERVFADTGWEHPKTYDYLRGDLTRALGPIHEVRGDLLFTDLVRAKRIFPDRTKRFCTVELKVKPIAAYLASLDEEIVNVVGIRRDESEARKSAVEWEYSKTLDCDVWRPIVAWSVADVIAIHKRHGLAPNPLYAMGASRVGCWPCIHARKSEIRLVADSDPARIDEIRALEHEVTEDARERAAAKGESLTWERALFSAHVGRNGHRPMRIDEAVAWARSESSAERARRERGMQVELFTDPSASCGEWGFCESTVAT